MQAFRPLPVSVVTADSRLDRHADWLDPIALAQAALPHSFHLIMTHDHGLDLQLCETLLARNDSGYIGLIGSKSKRARFARQLRAQALDPTQLTCPIGLPGLRGKEPAVIAASVVAEVLLRQSARASLEISEKKYKCY
jgi:xanthine dehydrogenase accessory factor